MNIYFLNKYNGKIRFVLNKIAEDFILWLTGGLFYFYLEIAFRNYSHYSMIICGGICFLIVGKIGEYILKRENNILKAEALIMFFGALAITSMELFTGIIVNLIFNMNVWDYSAMKYNIYGQICLAYTMIWSLLSLLCVYVFSTIKDNLFQKKEPGLK